MTVSQTVTGLSSGSYDVRIVGLLNATGRNVMFYGSATVEAKP